MLILLEALVNSFIVKTLRNVGKGLTWNDLYSHFNMEGVIQFDLNERKSFQNIGFPSESIWW